MKIITCYKCRTQFGMPDDLYAAAKAAAEKFTWYCPYGHAQHFVRGETETEKLKRQVDRLEQNEAYLRDRIRIAEEGEGHQGRSGSCGARTRSQVTARD